MSALLRPELRKRRIGNRSRWVIVLCALVLVVFLVWMLARTIGCWGDVSNCADRVVCSLNRGLLPLILAAGVVAFFMLVEIAEHLEAERLEQASLEQATPVPRQRRRPHHAALAGLGALRSPRAVPHGKKSLGGVVAVLLLLALFLVVFGLTPLRV